MTHLLLCADADDFDPEAGFAKDGDKWEGEDEELLKVGEYTPAEDRIPNLLVWDVYVCANLCGE